jgi:hypothetical protein
MMLALVCSHLHVCAPVQMERVLTPMDLRCGTRIPVYGKWLLVRRCDRHTRAWYKQVCVGGCKRVVWHTMCRALGLPHRARAVLSVRATLGRRPVSGVFHVDLISTHVD